MNNNRPVRAASLAGVLLLVATACSSGSDAAANAKASACSTIQKMEDAWYGVNGGTLDTFYELVPILAAQVSSWEKEGESAVHGAASVISQQAYQIMQYSKSPPTTLETNAEFIELIEDFPSNLGGALKICETSD